LKQSICPLHDEQLLLELLALHGADCFRLGVASDFFSGYTETWPVLTSPGLLFEFARQTAQVSKGDVPGTVVSFQFEAMAFSGAKKQLDLIMHAFNQSWMYTVSLRKLQSPVTSTFATLDWMRRTHLI